jgi:hypothetical protein
MENQKRAYYADLRHKKLEIPAIKAGNMQN